MSDRDKRALKILAAVAICTVAIWFLFLRGGDEVTAGIESVPLAEKRLSVLRRISATLPAKEAELKQVETELVAREKAIITTGTAAQAQARLLEVARKVGSANGIEIRGGDTSIAPKTFGDTYGQVFAGVNFNCAIDQFVNFFADLSKEPDLLAPNELMINTSGDPKAKMLSVRMVFAGIVSKKLVPEKKGFGL
jgi:hypothetical protein